MGLNIRILFKNIIGLLLLPITVVCTASFVSVLITVRWHIYPNHLLIIGFIVYLILHFLNKKKSFSYVLGHEISHAVTSIFFGGKLLSIFVSHKNGSVSTTKDNFVISLIPYCVPFYALLLSVFYYGLSIFINTRSFFPFFLFLLGFSLSHHLMLTIHYIKLGQNDISSHGRLFSFSIILLSNVFIIAFILGLFIQQLPFISFLQKSIESSKALFSDMFYYNH